MKTYVRILKDPIKKMISSLKSLITRWKNLKYITKDFYKKFRCNDDTLLYAYGLPKVYTVKSSVKFNLT